MSGARTDLSPISRAGWLGALVLSACLAAAPAAGAELHESFDQGGGGDSGLLGILLDGSDGPWQGSLESGAYRLSNLSDPSAVKYFHFGTMRGARPTQVAVEVSGSFDTDNSGAGLLYRFDPEQSSYFAFVVSGGGRYALYVRGPDGLRPLAAGTREAIAAEGPNRLRVELDGPSATLFVNDQQVMSHKRDGPPNGAEAGLIALSQGSFAFDDFKLVTE